MGKSVRGEPKQRTTESLFCRRKAATDHLWRARVAATEGSPPACRPSATRSILLETLVWPATKIAVLAVRAKVALLIGRSVAGAAVHRVRVSARTDKTEPHCRPKGITFNLRPVHVTHGRHLVLYLFGCPCEALPPEGSVGKVNEATT